MPEGHTIHRIARDHTRRFVGQALNAASPQGRFRAGAKRLDGLTLQKVDAHGKHLFYHWESDQILHIHLGLYGKFRNHRYPPPEPRGAVRLRVIGTSHAFDLNGPTACEIIAAEKLASLTKRLGQDPLRRDADPELAWDRIRRSRAAIGKLLLDQSIIAGVGNIYRAEALYATRIHPDRPGKQITRDEFDAIWDTLAKWLKIGVKYNRIITADANALGKLPGRLKREERLMIYKRPYCPQCDAEIAAWQSAARKIYACTSCQR